MRVRIIAPVPTSVWYSAQSRDLTHPVDRRRFPWWAAARGVRLQTEGSVQDVELSVLTPMGNLPYWLRLRARNPDLRLIFDMVDGYLAESKGGLRGHLRSLERVWSRRFSLTTREYKYWLQRVLQEADAVVVGSIEQADEARQFNANALSVADWHGEYPELPLSQPADESPLTLLWEGQGVTLKHLLRLAPALSHLAKEVGQVQLVVVSSMTTPKLGDRYFARATESLLRKMRSDRVDVRLVPWSTRAVADESRKAHLAVIPITPDDQFALMKPENKLLIYWRLGLPTLVSSTPSYTRVMNRAQVPGLCLNWQDWIDQASEVAQSQSAREVHVERGKSYLKQWHQDKQLLATWDEAVTIALSN